MNAWGTLARLEALEAAVKAAPAYPPLYFPPLKICPSIQSAMMTAVQNDPGIADDELRAMARTDTDPHPDSVEEAVHHARWAADFCRRQREKDRTLEPHGTV